MSEATSDALAPHETPPPTGEGLKFSTTLQPGRFLGLSLKNGLLNLITLTLYRFWGKTEVRQRVWRGVRLNDEAFEYTGRGIELFVGFLLALVALGAPALVLVFGAQFFGPWFVLAIYLPLYLFFFWLWGFGVFTAFRYMASRTTWRGVRFQLKGSAAQYGLQFIFAGFLSGLTAGWYWPAAERRLAEKIWDELRFGDKRIRFRLSLAEREGVYGAYALGWFGSIVGYLLLVMAVFAATMALAPPETLLVDPAANQPNPVPQYVMTLAIYGVMLLLSPLILLLWAPYQAAMLRSVAAGVTIDEARFRLKVKAIPLWWLTVTNLFFLLITFGFLMPWVQARTARFLIERLESAGAADLASARQAGRGPGSGEGLADAFGFSAI